MIRNEETKVVLFDTMIRNQRDEVLSWLRFKYKNLSYADAEDIFQEASAELWKKLSKEHWQGESMVGMLKTICRNIHGHWLRSQVWQEQWDEKFYPQDNGVEMDYGYITSAHARMLLKERMYEMIDRLSPKDRSLMALYFQNVRMDEIARQLGFRNAQVARNQKCKIVVKLCKDVNAQAANACAYLFYQVRLSSLREKALYAASRLLGLFDCMEVALSDLDMNIADSERSMRLITILRILIMIGKLVQR